MQKRTISALFLAMASLLFGGQTHAFDNDFVRTYPSANVSQDIDDSSITFPVDNPVGVDTGINITDFSDLDKLYVDSFKRCDDTGVSGGKCFANDGSNKHIQLNIIRDSNTLHVLKRGTGMPSGNQPAHADEMDFLNGALLTNGTPSVFEYALASQATLNANNTTAAPTVLQEGSQFRMMMFVHNAYTDNPLSTVPLAEKQAQNVQVMLDWSDTSGTVRNIVGDITSVNAFGDIQDSFGYELANSGLSIQPTGNALLHTGSDWTSFTNVTPIINGTQAMFTLNNIDPCFTGAKAFYMDFEVVNETPEPPTIDVDKTFVGILVNGKISTRTEILPGDQLSYNIRVEHTGAVGSESITELNLSDYFDSRLTFVGSNPINTGLNGNIIEWSPLSLASTGGVLEPGEFVTVTVTLGVPLDIEIDGSQGSDEICNSASATAPGVVPDANDSDYVCNPFDLPETGFEVTKQTDEQGPVGINDEVEYTIVVTNTGDSDLTNISVTDLLEDYFTFTDVIVQSPFTVNVSPEGDNEYLFDVNGTLSAGASITITLTVTLNEYPIDGQACNGIDDTIEAWGTYNEQSYIATYIENQASLLCVPAPEPQDSEFEVRKVATPINELEIGDVVTYTIEVENTGETFLDNITIEDNLEAYFTFEGASIAQPFEMETDVNGQQIFFNLEEDLAPGQTAIITLTVTLNAFPSNGEACNGLNGALVATANVSSTNEEITALNDFDAQDVCVEIEEASPRLSVEKITNEQGPISVGDTVEYQIVVTNTGTADLETVTVVDTLQPYFTMVDSDVPFTQAGQEITWNLGMLPANSAPETITFTVELNSVPANGADACNGLSDTLVAYGGYNGTLYYAGNSIVPGNVCVPVTPNETGLEISKSTEETGPLSIGDTVEYEIVVTNTGNTDLEGITVMDDLESYYTYEGATPTPLSVQGQDIVWMITSLDAGLTETITLTVTLNAYPPNGEACNGLNGALVASVKYENDTIVAVNNFDASDVCVPVTPEETGLTITKTTDENGPLNIGDTVEYEIVVTNTGDVSLGNVEVEDELESYFDFVSATVASPYSMETEVDGDNVTFELNQNLSTAAPMIITLSVELTAYPEDFTACNGLNGDLIGSGTYNGEIVTATTTISPSDVCVPVTPPNSGFEVAKTSNPSEGTVLVPGDTIEYTITATNTGNTVITNLNVQDELVDIVTYQGITQNSNGAAITQNGDTISITFPTVNAGQTVSVTFAVTVNLLDPSDEHEVCNTITAPTGTVNGETVTGTVTTGPVCHTIGKPLIDKVVTSIDGDYNLTYDSDGNVISPVAGPGSIITYEIQTSMMPAGAPPVPLSVTDQFDADLFTLVSVSPQNLCNLYGPNGSNEWVIICNENFSDDFVAGDSVLVTLQVNEDIDASDVPAEGMCNTGIIESTGWSQNMVDTACVPFEDEPDAPAYTVVKSSDPTNNATVEVGDIVTYTFTVENTGNIELDEITIFDTLPAEVDYEEFAGTNSDITLSSSNPDSLSISVGPIAVDQIITVNFPVRVIAVPQNQTQQFCNTFSSISIYQGDIAVPPSNTPNTVCHTVTEEPVPNFDLIKTTPSTYVEVGDIVPFIITVVNTGETTLTDIIITDTLEDYFAYLPTGGSNDPTVSGQTLTWNVAGPIAIGGQTSVTFNVEVLESALDEPVGTGGLIELDNVACATTDETGGPTGQEECDEETVVITPPTNSFYVTKTANPAAGTTVNEGDSIDYTITVVNTGTSVLDEVVVIDVLENELTYVGNDPAIEVSGSQYLILTFSDIEPGQANAQSIVIETILNEYPADGEVCNVLESATGITEYGDPVTGTIPTQPICHPVTPPETDASLTLTKVALTAGPIVVGQEVEYLITVTNTGEVALTNIVVIDLIEDYYTFIESDPALGNQGGGVYSWNFAGPLAPGGEETITLTVELNALPTNNYACNGLNGDLTAVATQENGEEVTVITNVNSNEVCVPVEDPESGFEVAKTSDPVAGTVVEGGDTITYFITVTNTGDTVLETVTVTDELPAAVTYTDNNAAISQNGQTLTLTFTDVQPGANNTQTIGFEVTVNELEGDELHFCNTIINPTATNENGEEVVGTVTTPPVCHEYEVPETDASLTLTKVALTAGPIVVGQEVEYLITVTNTGEVALTNIVVIDLIEDYYTFIESDPALGNQGGGVYSWNFAGPLAPGGEETITLTVELNALPTNNYACNGLNGDLTAVATQENGEEVTVITNVNSNEVCVPVEDPESGFEVAKTSDPVAGTVVEGGDTITYFITVTNTGDTVLETVTVTDELPSAVTYTDNNAAISQNGQTLTLTFTDVQPGANNTQTIGFEVTVNELEGDELHFCNTIINPTATNENGEEVVGTVTTPPVCHEYEVPETDASLTLTKVALTAGPIVVGQEVEYLITVTNTGEVALTNIVVIDLIEDYYTFIESDPALGNQGGGVYSWNFAGPLAPGGEETITLTVELNALPTNNYACNGLNGDLTAVATQENGEEVTVITNVNSNEVCVPVEDPESGFEVAKTSDPVAGTVVEGGDTITYFITVTNTGDTVLETVTVTDELPSAVTYTDNNAAISQNGQTLTLTFTDVQPGANNTQTIGFEVTVNDLVGDELHFCNTIINPTATNENGEEVVGTVTTPPVCHEYEVPLTPDFEIIKDTPTQFVNVGDEVVFTITVNNTGEVPLTDIVVTDELEDYFTFASSTPALDNPAETETLVWTIDGPIAVGGSTSISLTVTVNVLALQQPIMPNGQIWLTNTACATTNETGGEDGQVECDDDIVDLIPDDSGFTVLKTADPVAGTPVGMGDTITYTIAVTNTGSTTLADVTVVDVLDSYLTYTGSNPNIEVDGLTLTLTFTDIEPGETATLEIPVEVSGHCGEVCNTIAYAFGVDENDEPVIGVYPSAPVCHPFVEESNPDFIINKVASVDEVEVGDEFTFDITVTNTGDIELTNIVITDELEDYFTFVSSSPELDDATETETLVWTIDGPLAIGETTSITLTVTVNDDATANAPTLENKVCAVTDETGTTTECDEDTVVIEEPGTPNFTITKTADTETVNVGDTFTFAIVVTNTGETPLTDIYVTDSLHPYFDFVSSTPGLDDDTETVELAWTIAGPLAVGQSTTITLTVDVNSLALAEAPSEDGTIGLSNVVCAQTAETGDIERCDDETVTTTPEDEPGFTVTKTAVPAAGTTIYADDVVEYTITVTNTGDVALATITVVDVLDAEWDYIDDLDTVVAEGQTLTLTFSDVAVDESKSITFDVQLNAVPEDGEICNGISLAVAEDADGNPTIYGDLPAPICHVVDELVPSFTVNKTSTSDGEEIVVGEDFSFDITVTNTGELDLNPVVVTDNLPSGLEYVTHTSNVNVAHDQGELTIDFGALAVDASQTVNIVVKVIEEGEQCNGTDNITATGGIADDADAEPVDGTESGNVCITGLTQNVPEIEIVKSSISTIPSTVPLGAILPYSITVTNTGNVDLTDVVVTDILEESIVSYLTAVDQGITFPQAGTTNVVEIVFGELAVGETQTKTFKIQLVNATAGAQIDNFATVTADSEEGPVGPVDSNIVEHKVAITIVNPPGGGSGAPTYTPNPPGVPPTVIIEQPPVIIEQPLLPMCEVRVCPACFKSNQFDIQKEVQDASGQWMNSQPAAVALGDSVNYRVFLDLNVENEQGYEVTDAELFVYDTTVPTNSGGLFSRDVHTNGFNWAIAGGDANAFRYQLSAQEMNQLNNGLTIRPEFAYSMDTSLMPAYDIAESIENVAFAVFVMEYTDTDGNVAYHVQEVGTGSPVAEGSCENAITDVMIADQVTRGAESLSTYGDTAYVNIVRPFALATQGAAMGVSASAETVDRAFGTNIPQEYFHTDYAAQYVYSDNTDLYVSPGGSANASFSEVTEYIETQEEYLGRMMDNAGVSQDLAPYFATASGAGSFRKAAGQNLYFYDQSELVVAAGDYAVSEPITIVIPNGDVVIEGDFTTSGAPIAFVLLNGSIFIENDAETIEGVFVIQNGEMAPYDADGVTELSILPLRIYGLVVGGNPEALFASRHYLGENPSQDGFEPSVEIILDERVFDQEPPSLSVMMGSAWDQVAY